jgi:hypothetical protein
MIERSHVVFRESCKKPVPRIICLTASNKNVTVVRHQIINYTDLVVFYYNDMVLSFFAKQNKYPQNARNFLRNSMYSTISTHFKTFKFEGLHIHPT